MLLCVDGDDAAREDTVGTLRGAGFDVVEASSLADARDRLDETVDSLVTEQELPDGTGLELIRTVRDRIPDTNCILYTDLSIDEIDTAAFGDVVAEYVRKGEPGADEELISLVQQGVAFQTQTAYPLPDNEPARLAALERYAGDPAALGESFDRLTELATELFDLDAAAVGLVDAHEQRFLACHGITLDPLPREETVCTYAMLDAGVTVIEDVAEDPRFDENEGLAAANIRFYASAPVETPEGEVIGTFCVYDDDAREFSSRDRELLSMLADEAMDQLTLRRRLRDGGPDDV